MVQTASDIHRYVRCTLLNSTRPFEDVVKSARDSPSMVIAIRNSWNGVKRQSLYTSTPLGRASFGSSLCPEESLVRSSYYSYQRYYLLLIKTCTSFFIMQLRNYF